MTVPAFWRAAEFSVAEMADLIGVSEVTLRTWLMRNPYPEFVGTKELHRVFFTAKQIFFYLIVHKLGAYGVPIRTAMAAASNYASDGLPLDKWLIVRTDGTKTEFELAEDIPFLHEPALVLPLRALAIGMIARAADVYARELN